MVLEGYSHPLYAESFFEIGQPLFLPRSKGWIIKRPISGTDLFDAMGPYPLFCCDDWNTLLDDLQDLREDLVSLSMVLDPFADVPMEGFDQFFDIFSPYKDHYLLDTSLPLIETISKWSRRDARRALKEVSVDVVSAPHIDLDEWLYVYEHLIKRHNVTGIRTFSRESFSRQIAIPNTHFYRAWDKNELVGGNLYFIQNKIAYGHLLALTDRGYHLGASHAIKWTAIHTLGNQVEWFNWGGGTGLNNANLSGLDKFKMGWSNTTKQAYFCAKVYNKGKYEELAAERGFSTSNWFPAYRSGDF